MASAVAASGSLLNSTRLWRFAVRVSSEFRRPNGSWRQWALHCEDESYQEPLETRQSCGDFGFQLPIPKGSWIHAPAFLKYLKPTWKQKWFTRWLQAACPHRIADKCLLKPRSRFGCEFRSQLGVRIPRGSSDSCCG